MLKPNFKVMKHVITRAAYGRYALTLVALLFMASCREQVEQTFTYAGQVPVIMEVSAFRAMEIGSKPGKPIESSGKIYVYGNYLLINEPQEGIHIVDNTDPAQPRNIAFLDIPGNVDMAVNSNILYADSYIDLVAFDISDIRNVRLVERVEEVFPHMFYDTDRARFITYKDTIITTTVDEQGQFGWGWFGWGPRAEMFSMASSDGGGSYGQGGSMARFTLMSGHLYAVDNTTLRLFNVAQADKPTFVKDIPIGWGIETIFPYKQKLFIGSMTGMYIYDASNPAAPEQMAVYQHMRACDPVVVNDDYAFVTLRSGTSCRFGDNALHVLDISDLYAPTLVKALPMDNPHGLGLAGDHLYICEGDFGLKSFNASDVTEIGNRMTQHLKDRRSFDVIPAQRTLIVTGPDGVCQYDYSKPDELKLISCIQVQGAR